MRIVRTGISIDKDLLKRLDEFIQKRGLRNRSRVIEEAVRLYLSEREWIESPAKLVGAIIVIYDHAVADTNKRLISIQHKYLYIIKSLVHVHITRDRCMDVILIEGYSGEVVRLINELESISGVRLVKPSFIQL